MFFGNLRKLFYVYICIIRIRRQFLYDKFLGI